MSKFTSEPTFCDDFSGELDRSVWSGHYQYGTTTEARKGSYWNQHLAYTEDGNLIIPVVYLEDGMGGTGAGWYTAGIDTDSDSPNGFSQKYGYFECRCILPEGADVWSAFTAPFDVANIYVVETYPENELAAMESAEDGVGRTDILMAQAQHNADFASFFAVTIALKQNKTFETIYQEYINWANMRDDNLELKKKSDYTPSGMKLLTPYDGSNWADANCYIYENKGPWLITADNLDANTNIPTKFTTQWGFVDTSDGKLMNQGMTYSMLLPYCMGCGDDISMRDFWDYWSGKFLIFESTDGPHTIHGTDYMESIVSGLEAEESSAVLTGNSTFASIGVSEVYQYNADLQSSEFTRKSTMDLLPTESFLKPNVTTPSKIIGIRRTGEIIYDDDNNGNQNGTSGHIPTVGGGNDLFITSIEGGINVAVAAPQYVRVLSSTGSVIYSGMIQTALDIQLPSLGMYVVSGEKEVQKVMY
jgi:hypothetical protein